MLDFFKKIYPIQKIWFFSARKYHDFLGIVETSKELSIRPKEYNYFSFSVIYFLKSLFSVFLLNRYSSEKITSLNVNRKNLGLIDDRLKIAHLVSNVTMGGTTKIIYDIMSNIPFPMVMIDLNEHTYFDSQSRTFLKFKNQQELLQILKQQGINILHVHYYGNICNMDKYFKYLCENLDSKVKIIENCNEPRQSFIHKRIKKYVYVSYYAKSIQKTKTNKDVVIYPGVDMKVFKPKSKPNKEKYPVVGFVYRLAKDKIDERAIELMIKIVKALDKKVTVHIVGNGILFNHYLKRVYEEGVRDRFVFFGFIDYQHLDNFYNKFDVFIAPVHTESYGLVVPYAMAKKIPVVANDIGAIPEILGKCGDAVNTEQEFVDCVVDIVKHRKTFLAKTKGSRERIKERMSADKMISGYKNLYLSYVKQIAY